MKLVCPRCGGRVMRDGPDGELSCLLCNRRLWEPPQPHGPMVLPIAHLEVKK